ncbi:MAG: nickel pincer cofactor biosynthesis protein LarB [Candidatus Eisenbacteria bacterium]
MERKAVKRILADVKDGKISMEMAIGKLSTSYESLGFARVDVGRKARTGVMEVLLCEGKTYEQIASIAKTIFKRNKRLLATRADQEAYKRVNKAISGAVYNETARTIVVAPHRKLSKRKIAVVSAGTSDIPVAEEAAVTAEFLGNRVERLFDVGVAGIHRLFGHLDVLEEANVIIVVAGMEGALASVVGGLVGGPIIGVPTSVGYGASFNGLASLLTMLNSCAPGVTVVNIDNGFGAGVAASLINSKGS